MLEFHGTVVDVMRGGILLDQTAFYPEGGGQEWDLGTLDGYGSSASAINELLSGLGDDNIMD